MSLLGLPDFGAPVELKEQVAGYHPFGGRGPTTVVPASLRVAERLDDRGSPQPEFLLQRFRPANVEGPPPPYVLLTIAIEPDFPLAEVLEMIRQTRRDAAVTPASLGQGTVRLAVLGEIEHDVAVDVEHSVSWDGLSSALFNATLTPPQYSEFRAAIESDFSRVSVRASVDLRGVGARSEVRITLEPSLLVEDLTGLRDGSEFPPRGDAIAWIRTKLLPSAGDAESPLLVLEGTSPEDDVAEALADRLRGRYHDLFGAATLGSGRWEWDLAEAHPTWRPHHVTLPLFDAFEAVRREPERFIPAGVELSPVPLGWTVVHVMANFPDHVAGLVAGGVDIIAPPRPPARAQAATKTVEFTGHRRGEHVTLKLAPGEPPDFLFQVWAVISDRQGAREVRGEMRPFRGDRLFLRPIDFPISLIAVSAESALLEQAKVVVGLAKDALGEAMGQELTHARPETHLPLSHGSEEDRVVVSLFPYGEGDNLVLGPFPPTPLRVGRHLIPAWGPHTIDVSADFHEGEHLVAVEIRPETEKSGEVLSLTRDRPSRTWTWFADNPFRGGYSFRVLPPGGDPGAWSEARDHRQPLHIGPT